MWKNFKFRKRGRKILNLFAVFYFLILFFIWLLTLPFLVILSFKEKYKSSIPARFFCIKNSPLKENTYWFHACSFGEVLSLESILEKLDNFSITTITQTGFNQAKKYTNSVSYLPFEIFLPFWIKKQKKLIVLEAELWFMLFFISKKRGIKTILLNARISNRSFPKYLKFRWFYKILFKSIDKIFCQSMEDKIRLEKLGAKNVEIFGNIKAFKKPKVTKEYKKPNRLVITIASTHKDEEKLILNAIKNIKNAIFIIVPRHPERFEYVKELIKDFSIKNNLTYSFFTQNSKFNTDIVVIDTLGELINIYAISDIVILGGSFYEYGGHNPIEPAYFGCKLISGPYIFNQYALFDLIENYYICKADKLQELLLKKDNLKNASIKNIDSKIARLIEIINE